MTVLPDEMTPLEWITVAAAVGGRQAAATMSGRGRICSQTVFCSV
jgi:hypothetical protein